MWRESPRSQKKAFIADDMFIEEDMRLLTFQEIEHASEQLQVDFVGKHMIPVIDCFDNDFAVYCFDRQKWALYNIVDDTSFNARNSLKELIGG